MRKQLIIKTIFRVNALIACDEQEKGPARGHHFACQEIGFASYCATQHIVLLPFMGVSSLNSGAAFKSGPLFLERPTLDPLT
jgi:hypothetical protein